MKHWFAYNKTRTSQMPNNHHTFGRLQKNDLGHSVLTSGLMQNNRRYSTRVDESHVRFGMRRKHAVEVGFLLRRI